jgi:hypothetical protein
MKWLRFVFGSIIVVAAAVFTAVQLGDWEVRRLNRQNEELQREKATLLEFARRLSASRRVAQVTVDAQRKTPEGIVNALTWQEIGAEGAIGAPQKLETRGELVYFEALVIKFNVTLPTGPLPPEGAEPGIPTSLALFRRIFGDGQSPASVAELDRAARPPSRVSDDAAAEAKLWARFWEMVDDPRVADRFGVRVAQIEAPAVPVKAGQVWEVTLDAAGGLNVRKLREATR